jgi:hypothetical protein
MNHSEMSPELRASIEATAKALASDSNPVSPESNKAQEVATKYVAEEGPALKESINAEQAALQEARDAIGAEYENKVKAELESAYDEAMTEVLFNAGLTIKSERAQHMIAAKAETVNTVMTKIGLEKTPSDKITATLIELLPELVPEFKQASA